MKLLDAALISSRLPCISFAWLVSLGFSISVFPLLSVRPSLEQLGRRFHTTVPKSCPFSRILWLRRDGDFSLWPQFRLQSEFSVLSRLHSRTLRDWFQCGCGGVCLLGSENMLFPFRTRRRWVTADSREAESFSGVQFRLLLRLASSTVGCSFNKMRARDWQNKRDPKSLACSLLSCSWQVPAK